jgi:hypothetical protein
METNMIYTIELIPVVEITIITLSWAIAYLMLQGRAKSIKELNKTFSLLHALFRFISIRNRLLFSNFEKNLEGATERI